MEAGVLVSPRFSSASPGAASVQEAVYRTNETLQEEAVLTDLAMHHDARSRHTFEARFESACRKYGVDSCDSLLLSSDLTSLTLSGKGCGERGVKALAEAISGRSTFHSITIRDSFMGCEGAVCLMEALLLCPQPPHRIDLTGGNIRGKGTRAIAKFVEKTAVQEVHLEWNGAAADHDSFKELMRAVAASKTLVHLDLRHNHIGSDMCDAVAEMLQTSVLTSLDLRWNQITAAGSAKLAAGMRACGGLLTLHLSGNTVDHTHLSAINDKLKENAEVKLNPHTVRRPPSPRARTPPSSPAPLMSPGRVSGSPHRLHIASPKAQQQWAVTRPLSPPSPDPFAFQTEQLVRGPSPMTTTVDPRMEAVQQRNRELSSQLATTRDQVLEMKRQLDQAELQRVASEGHIKEQQDKAQILENRVEHLEALNKQTEDVVQSRDIAMSLLRDKAATYQRRLDDLMRLSDGRNMDDVVKELSQDNTVAMEDARKKMLCEFAVEKETILQATSEEAAVLKHELNSAHNRLALQSKAMADNAAHMRSFEKSLREARMETDEANARCQQMVAAGDLEHRQMLTRVEDSQKSANAAEERIRVLERRVEEERSGVRRVEAAAQIAQEKGASAMRDDRNGILRKLTAARDANEALREENDNLKSELRRARDDEQAFKERLERRVQDQVTALMSSYSTPLQALHLSG